jgi:hypothetical protein
MTTRRTVPLRAAAHGRADQFVLVPGEAGGYRGGQVPDVVAAGRGLVPALVVVQGGLGEFERAFGVLREGVQVGDVGGGQVADRAADRVAVPEQFLDAVAGDEAGSAGDEHSGHHGSPSYLYSV